MADIFIDDPYGVDTLLCVENTKKTPLKNLIFRILLLQNPKKLKINTLFNVFLIFFKKICINLHKTFDFLINIVYNNNCNKILLKE